MPGPRVAEPWLKPDPILVQMFREYLAKMGDGHTRQTLSSAFFLHQRFMETGTMLPPAK